MSKQNKNQENLKLPQKNEFTIALQLFWQKFFDLIMTCCVKFFHNLIETNLTTPEFLHASLGEFHS